MDYVKLYFVELTTARGWVLRKVTAKRVEGTNKFHVEDGIGYRGVEYFAEDQIGVNYFHTPEEAFIERDAAEQRQVVEIAETYRRRLRRLRQFWTRMYSEKKVGEPPSEIKGLDL